MKKRTNFENNYYTISDNCSPLDYLINPIGSLYKFIGKSPRKIYSAHRANRDII